MATPVLLAANQVALAVTTLAVVAAAGSLVGRFRRARGAERLQLRWVALAALLVALAGVVVLAGLAVGVASASTLLSVAVGFCLATLPVATGAAVLRYRLDDRILSRTLAYGCSPCCWVAATPPWPWCSVSCLGGTRPWPWPGPSGRGRAVPAGPPPGPGGRRRGRGSAEAGQWRWW